MVLSAPTNFERIIRIGSATGALEDVLCQVEHYLADSDIRRSDSGYRAMQDGEMQKLISTLGSGRLSDAAKISFIGDSK
jgi:hypothetical protein